MSQDDFQALLDFYQVSTIEELVAVQANQIERLQKRVTKLEPNPWPFPSSSPRVG